MDSSAPVTEAPTQQQRQPGERDGDLDDEPSRPRRRCVTERGTKSSTTGGGAAQSWALAPGGARTPASYSSWFCLPVRGPPRRRRPGPGRCSAAVTGAHRPADRQLAQRDDEQHRRRGRSRSAGGCGCGAARRAAGGSSPAPPGRHGRGRPGRCRAARWRGMPGWPAAPRCSSAVRSRKTDSRSARRRDQLGDEEALLGQQPGDLRRVERSAASPVPADVQPARPGSGCTAKPAGASTAAARAGSATSTRTAWPRRWRPGCRPPRPRPAAGRGR